MFASISLWAQQAPPPPPGGEGYGPPHNNAQGPSHAGPGHHPGDHMFHAGPPGKWWSDPGVVQRLGISADQQKKMEGLFQQNRLRLIDLSAALQKEEAILDPLLHAERPDEPRVLAQIDRIAQARAELEKANARFLLGIRDILTPDQWHKLEAEAPPPPPPDGMRAR